MSDKANKNSEKGLIEKLKSQATAQPSKGTPDVADQAQKQALKEKLAKKLEEGLHGNSSFKN